MTAGGRTRPVHDPRVAGAALVLAVLPALVASAVPPGEPWTQAEKKLRKAVVEKRLDSGLPATSRVMEFVLVPADTFTMGRTAAELTTVKSALNAYHHEFSTPDHRVEVATPFLVARSEVTNSDYRSFLDDSRASKRLSERLDPKPDPAAAKPKAKAGSAYSGPKTPPEIEKLLASGKDSDPGWDRPVSDVTWEEAMEFCRWLSEKTGLTVRLPTEIEWEYAARGPDGSSAGPIGKPPRNESWCGARWMGDRVTEWCLEVFDEGAYAGRRLAGGTSRQVPWETPVPDHAAITARRPIRGGSDGDHPVNAEPATRRWKTQNSRAESLGFRPVVVIPPWVLDTSIAKPPTPPPSASIAATSRARSMPSTGSKPAVTPTKPYVAATTKPPTTPFKPYAAATKPPTTPFKPYAAPIKPPTSPVKPPVAAPARPSTPTKPRVAATKPPVAVYKPTVTVPARPTMVDPATLTYVPRDWGFEWERGSIGEKVVTALITPDNIRYPLKRRFIYPY